MGLKIKYCPNSPRFVKEWPSAGNLMGALGWGWAVHWAGGLLYRPDAPGSHWVTAAQSLVGSPGADISTLTSPAGM